MAENALNIEGNFAAILSYLLSIGAFIFIALIMALTIKKSRTRTIIWFFLLNLSMAIFCTGDLLTILTGNMYLQKFIYSTIAACTFIFCLFFFVSSMYTHISKAPILTAIFFQIMISVLAWLPTPEIFLIISFVNYYILPLAIAAMLLIWASITFIDAPWFAKTPAKLLLISNITLTIFNVLIASLPLEISIPAITGSELISAGVIFKHPGIISFLSYKAQYLVLLDKKGETIYEQYWTPKKGVIPAGLVEESRDLVSMLKRFDGLVKGTHMGLEVFDLEISKSAILIYTGSRNFNVGLIARHSSRALRDGIFLFARKVDEIREGAGLKEGDNIDIQIMTLLKARMLNHRAIN